VNGLAILDAGDLRVKDHASGEDGVDHGSVAIVSWLCPIVAPHEKNPPFCGRG
jgi:hypothetical protein